MPDLTARIYQPGGLFNPEWFRIEGGDDHDGQLHISAWSHSAVGGRGFATCPICHAMVVDEGRGPFGDQTWAHEAWHARTDFPVPAELLTDADRKAGYARVETPR